MPRSPIEDPTAIFSLLVQEYRKLEPTMAITQSKSDAIDIVVSNIVQGEKVKLFKSDAPFEIQAFNSWKIAPSVRCSDRLAGFFEKLAEEMNEQQCFRVSPSRAVELLYNFDCDDPDFSQDLMRMEQHKGGFSLSSTDAFAEVAGAKLRMKLNPRDAYDWSLD